MNIYQELNRLLDNKEISASSYHLLVLKLREYKNMVSEYVRAEQWENEVVKIVEIPTYISPQPSELNNADEDLNIKKATDALIEKAFKICRSRAEMASRLGLNERTFYRHPKVVELSNK